MPARNQPCSNEHASTSESPEYELAVRQLWTTKRHQFEETCVFVWTNMPPKKKKAKGNSGVENPPFSWADEWRVEALTGCCSISPTRKERYDWESVKTKYPRKDCFGKVKSMHQKYRTALDSGRRSGGGWIVAQFFDVLTNEFCYLRTYITCTKIRNRPDSSQCAIFWELFKSMEVDKPKR